MVEMSKLQIAGTLIIAYFGQGKSPPSKLNTLTASFKKWQGYILDTIRANNGDFDNCCISWGKSTGVQHQLYSLPMKGDAFERIVDGNDSDFYGFAKWSNMCCCKPCAKLRKEDPTLMHSDLLYSDGYIDVEALRVVAGEFVSTREPLPHPPQDSLEMYTGQDADGTTPDFVMQFVQPYLQVPGEFLQCDVTAEMTFPQDTQSTGCTTDLTPLVPVKDSDLLSNTMQLAGIQTQSESYAYLHACEPLSPPAQQCYSSINTPEYVSERTVDGVNDVGEDRSDCVSIVCSIDGEYESDCETGMELVEMDW